MSDRYWSAHAPAAPTWTPEPPIIVGQEARDLDALTRTSICASLVRQLAALLDVPASNPDNVLLAAIVRIFPNAASPAAERGEVRCDGRVGCEPSNGETSHA